MRNAINIALFILTKYYRLLNTILAYAAAVLLNLLKQKQYIRKAWEPTKMQQVII